jgi:hypothetical protein
MNKKLKFLFDSENAYTENIINKETFIAIYMKI